VLSDGFGVRRDGVPLDRREEPHDLAGRGNRGAVLLRGVHQNHRRPAQEPPPGYRIEIGHGEPGKQLAGLGVFVADPRNPVARQEMADQFAGQRLGFGLVPLGVGLLEAPEHIAASPVQLGLGEPVPAGALELGENRLQPPPDAGVADHGAEAERLRAPHQLALAGPGPDEGRVRLLGQFPEPLVEHLAGQALEQVVPPPRHRAARPGGTDEIDREARAGGLGIGRDRDRRLAAHRDPDQRPCRGPDGRRYRAEPLPDEMLDPGGVEIAHRHNRHEVGAVPGLIEPADRLRRTGSDALRGPDRQSVGVPGILEQHRQVPVEHSLPRPPARSPFLQHHPALLPDLGGVERHAVSPVFQNLERAGQNPRAVIGHLELIHRLVEGGRGVEIGPEAHPDGLDVVHQFLLGEVGGTVERHVLDEMSQSPLVVVLQHRPGVHHQTEFGPVRRPPVDPDVVAEPIGEPAGRDR
jgi:hypothetical protein